MFKKIFKIIYSDDKNEIITDNARLTYIINLFSFAASVALLYFLIGGIIHHKVAYSISFSVFIALLIINLIYFYRKKNIKSAGYIVTLIFFLIFTSLILFLGTDTTALYWSFGLPIIAIFLTGKNSGLIISILLLLVCLAVFFAKIKGILPYPEILKERYIASYLAEIFLIYNVEIVREKTHTAFSISDKGKSDFLEEIMIQKEEIKAQSEALEEKNSELAQLSLVASESDNAILIADAEGNVEWLNKKYTEIYGYTLSDFKIMGKNLFELSHNLEEFEKIKTAKSTIQYSDFSTDKEGNQLWVQTYVTPFFEKNKLQKIILLETDITKIKEFEQNIIQKNEELLQQAEEINAQKEELENKNKIISQKNDAISQSINYAAKLQKAILPDINLLDHQNFLLFKPKDLVSGDFYWAESNFNYYFYATIDCTGHGVPAAFLSILGSRILSEIVNLRNILSPAKILENLHNQITKILKQQSRENSDGMDIILTRILKKNQTISEIMYCGAKRPLIYFDIDKKTIEKLNGIKRTIGGYRDDITTKFEDGTIELQTGSIIYLMTDGFSDQHSDVNSKYGSKKLFEFLGNNALLELNEQKEKICEEFERWKGDYMQIDDVTIWGIKL